MSIHTFCRAHYALKLAPTPSLETIACAYPALTTATTARVRLIVFLALLHSLSTLTTHALQHAHQALCQFLQSVLYALPIV